jgi:hypothetical protein
VPATEARAACPSFQPKPLAESLKLRCHRQSELDPAFSSFAITASRLKLAGFCRTGNSLKLCSHCAASTCIGTCPEARFAANFTKLGFHPGFGLTVFCRSLSARTKPN